MHKQVVRTTQALALCAHIHTYSLKVALFVSSLLVFPPNNNQHMFSQLLTELWLHTSCALKLSEWKKVYFSPWWWRGVNAVEVSLLFLICAPQIVGPQLKLKGEITQGWVTGYVFIPLCSKYTVPGDISAKQSSRSSHHCCLWQLFFFFRWLILFSKCYSPVCVSYFARLFFVCSIHSSLLSNFPQLSPPAADYE